MDLLLGQAFKFTINQFSAVVGWLISLALLYALSAQLGRRQVRRTPAGHGMPQRGTG